MLGSNFNFSVALRMLIGLIICLLLLLIKKQKLTLTRLAICNYLYAGIGIFITMSLVYHGSQDISSGIISIIFGLTPIITGVFVLLLNSTLNHEILTNVQLSGIIILVLIGLGVYEYGGKVLWIKK
ncbi:EamA family transporter [Candidatus Ruthia endofausta]|nr:EamA family transporter [Candidatus Ruthia endofausta]